MKSPRSEISFQLHPSQWAGERRDRVIRATRPLAHQLGMKRKFGWWVHWGMLEPISESQDLREYADACVAKLQDASGQLYPVLVDAISAEQAQP